MSETFLSPTSSTSVVPSVLHCAPVEYYDVPDGVGQPDEYWDISEAVQAIAAADPTTGGAYLNSGNEIVVNVTQDDAVRDAKLQALAERWPVIIRQVPYSRAELPELQLAEALLDRGSAVYNPMLNQVKVQLADPESAPTVLAQLVEPPYDRFCLDPEPWTPDTPAAGP